MATARAAHFRLGEEDLVVVSWPDDAPALETLSTAERAVALLANQGLSNADIARTRHVSQRTVANQLASVFAKLGIGSRIELAVRLAARSAR